MQVRSASMKASWLTRTALLSAAVICQGAAAYAQDCNADVGGLMKKRFAMMEQLNANAKANKGKLDPVAGCAKLRALAAADRDVLGYFTKNKDWCSIPDDAIANMSADLQKTQAVAGQACSVAEKMKKAQEQQAAGIASQAQKLPTGPL
jgi:hypothetical protein